MSWRQVLRIRELGTPRYWSRRLLYRGRAERWARFVAGARQRFTESGTGASAALRLLFRSLGSILTAIVAVLLVEAASLLIRLTPWGASTVLFNPPDSELDESVTALVGGAVAIAATLLGLYYTTVGVTASTIYKSVPGDVRDLFITERSGESYLKVVILTIAAGVVVLVAGALDLPVSGLTLLFLGLMAAFTCIGLVVVTKHLFDYFDPSKLSLTLLTRINRGIRVATDRKTRSAPQRQADAYSDTNRALASFRHLVELLQDRELRNATAPVALSRQLLSVLHTYSNWKYAIPTDSNWWHRVPRHQNWLTLDHSRLQIALHTSVGYAAESQPDFLWLENTIARLLRKSLAVAFRSQGGANGLAISEDVSTLAWNLAARLQIEEALAVAGAWDDVVLSVTTTSDIAGADTEDHEIRMNQMAAAESTVMPLTQMLLGLRRAAEMIVERDLPAEFDRAVRDTDALYRGTLPTETRQMLEGFARAIEREQRIEGRRITPAWWVNHLAARTMAEALLATEAGVLGEIRTRTTEQVARFRAEGRDDLAAVTGMRALELLHKVEFHGPTIRAAEARLAAFRNENIGIELWPERSAEPFDPKTEHMEMLKTVSELLPALRKQKFDPREPDLYGQLYQFTIDGAFRAILDGDDARGLAMYAAALVEMDPARLRILADLDRQDVGIRLTYAVEPIITAMDLAGYALLMHELNGSGIWPKVKQIWDTLLEASPQVAEFALSMASYVDSVFALTVGGLERSRRSTELNRLLQERGIRQEEWHAWAGGSEPPPPHSSPIVSAFAADGFGMQDDLYVLFIAEYLKHHLPAEAALGFKAKALAETIERFRTSSRSPKDPDNFSDA